MSASLQAYACYYCGHDLVDILGQCGVIQCLACNQYMNFEITINDVCDIYPYTPEIDESLSPYQKFARRIYSIKLLHNLADDSISLNQKRLKEIADDLDQKITHHEAASLFSEYTALTNQWGLTETNRT